MCPFASQTNKIGEISFFLGSEILTKNLFFQWDGLLYLAGKSVGISPFCPNKYSPACHSFSF